MRESRKTLRLSFKELKKIERVVKDKFENNFSDFFRFASFFLIRHLNENSEKYEKDLKAYLLDLKRDKERIMEERGLRLETKEISKTYRKRLPRNYRKTIRQ